VQPSSPSSAALRRAARAALAEDRWRADRTSRALVPPATEALGVVLAQATGTVSGLAAARAVAKEAGLSVRTLVSDGDEVRAGTPVLELRGSARSILAVERTLLNFLMHLSGVATATAAAVRAVGATGPQVFATRKTLPGLRDLEKAAVVHGGGRPHRRDLSDAFLVKSNHLALVPLERAVGAAERSARGRRVQVEVRSLPEARSAARAGARAILIDNATPAEARHIVDGLRAEGLRARLHIELSGGIDATNADRYRATGADAISLGALTHSAAALPFHLRLRTLRRR
jgi:nicotinate-nucleotide pyrophosphorylase (carboxylating)